MVFFQNQYLLDHELLHICTALYYKLEDGSITHAEEVDLTEIPIEGAVSGGPRDFFWEDWFDGIKCPTFGKKKTWMSKLWDWIVDKTKTTGSSGGGHTPPGYNSWSFPTYHTNTTSNSSGGGAGGGSSYDSYESIILLYERGFFNGNGRNINRMLEAIIAEHDIQICVADLHKLLYECLNEVASDPSLCLNTGILLPGDPDDIADEGNSFLTMNDYEELLSKINTDNVSCLTEIINNSRTDVDLVSGDGAIICYLDAVNLGVDNGVVLDILNAECGSDKYCRKEKVKCIARLKSFQDEYGIVLDGPMIQRLIFASATDLCAINPSSETAFNEAVFDEFVETITSFVLNNYLGERIRLLDCASFNWSLVGNAWVSCLDPNLMQIEVSGTGVYFNLDMGCLTFTVPNTRIDQSGNIVQVISSDEASTCSAMAANLATLGVKQALRYVPAHQINTTLTNWTMRKLFKSGYQGFTVSTTCGSLGPWGTVIATCGMGSCPGGTSTPIYTDDFIEITEESLLGQCH